QDTEVLDSSVYRSKASLGRKRRHRAPALRPGATSEGDSWIFQDSTGWGGGWPKAGSAWRGQWEDWGGGPVPCAHLTLLCTQAKLRGRNRSVEEGTLPGDSKATPAKDPHAQRSKDQSGSWGCFWGAYAAAMPTPPRSDASPPHWLPALKLKKKKP
ncbi:182 kDa tankyrase-1-binding protein, partial [Mesitornis unicolor]